MEYFLKWFIFFLLLSFIIKRFFSPPGSRQKSSSPSDNQSVHAFKNESWSFIAMRYYALILNRTYKVIVTDKYICGIHSGGALASPLSKIGSEWQNAEYYSDSGIYNKYEDIDFESESFLAKDKANFRIALEDVVKIDYHPRKWGMGRVPHSGRLVLFTKKGAKIELILLGNQDSDVIKKRLLQE